MSSEKGKFKWQPPGVHQHELGSASNCGRKLLEKMGWQDGLGLGKHNQGMVDNPLWNYRRNEHFKGGFKTKDEIFEREILAHQNAFEDLLGNLNAQISEGSEISHAPNLVSRASAKVSTRQPRYLKMARAKDIRSYSINDLKGIIGRDVTKRNLSSLQQTKTDDKNVYNIESKTYWSSASTNGNYSNRKKCGFLETHDKNDYTITERTLKGSTCIKDMEGHVSQDGNIKTKRMDSLTKMNKATRRNSYNNLPKLVQNADRQITIEESTLDNVKNKKAKKYKNREKYVDINKSTQQCVNIPCEENWTKDSQSQITLGDWFVGEIKIKKKKRKKKGEVDEKINVSDDPILEIANLNVKEDNLSKDAAIRVTNEDWLVDKDKKPKRKKRKKEEYVEFSTWDDPILEMDLQNLAIEENFTKDAAIRVTSEDGLVDKDKKKRKKKRKKGENVEFNTWDDPVLNIKLQNLTIEEDNLSKDAAIRVTSEDWLVNKDEKPKGKNRKIGENVEFNTWDNPVLNMELENLTNEEDNLSKVDNRMNFRWHVPQVDEDLVAQVCEGFIGANLSSIKGYGNW